MTLSTGPWWWAPVFALGWIPTVPAQSFSAPARAWVIAAARFIPGVCAVLMSSSFACTTRTPRCFHFDSLSMCGILAAPDSTCSARPDEGNSLVGLELSVVCVIFLFKVVAFMASPTHPPANAGKQDLASRIYVELVGRAF